MQNSVYFEECMQRQVTIVREETEIEEQGVSLKFPKTARGRIMYVISFPIIICLVLTIPDVRKSKFKKCFAISFIMSIVWLAFFSYLMVWWATVFGNTVGIPSAVMGLTLLAAGTSVPDLLTSVIVAKHG